MESMLKEDEMRDIYFHLQVSIPRRKNVMSYEVFHLFQEDKFRSLLMNTAEERFDAEFYEEQLRISVFLYTPTVCSLVQFF